MMHGIMYGYKGTILVFTITIKAQSQDLFYFYFIFFFLGGGGGGGCSNPTQKWTFFPTSWTFLDLAPLTP